MQENDARRLDHHTLEALRERAVRKVQEGESPEVVARVLGLNRSTVYGWLAQYRRGGWGALKARRGSRCKRSFASDFLYSWRATAGAPEEDEATINLEINFAEMPSCVRLRPANAQVLEYLRMLFSTGTGPAWSHRTRAGTSETGTRR